MAAASTTETKTALNGADIIIQCLVKHGTKTIFAYPGGCSMPLHQALRKFSEEIRTILPRHEQGGCFAAHGVARTTNEVGVCMATSGPGATNLVTAIADAKMDSIPLICITGQVPQAVIGTDAFQETPIVEICRPITKHHYLISAKDWRCHESMQECLRSIPRIMKEAFHVASTGRPGPILIDVPKNVQLAKLEGEIDWDPPMNLPGYEPINPPIPAETISRVVAAIKRSKKPIFYAGGGLITANAAEEFTKFARASGIPVATTVMGSEPFPETIHSRCTCSACTGPRTRTSPSMRPTCCSLWACGSMTA